MNPVNGVSTTNDVTTLNPAEMSKLDFISAVYLERGEMLDSEVRRLIGEIDKSNQYVDAINGLMGKANVAEYGASHYTSATWQVNNGSVVLDNGYGLNIQPDGNGGSTFTIVDVDGNQLIYQNQTLVPVPAGSTVNTLKVGIPVMNDMTFMLDDGTEISLKVSAPDTAFNQQNYSGGLANVSSIIITRDNQGMRIDNVNTASPVINAPTVENVTNIGNSNSDFTTETVNVPYMHYEMLTEYAGSEDIDDMDAFAEAFKNRWLAVIASKSPADRQAMMDRIRAQGSLTIKYVLGDSDSSNNYYDSEDHNSDSYRFEVFAGDTLESFFSRIVEQSSEDFKAYVDKEEIGNTANDGINIEYIQAYIPIPGYSFEKVVPDTEKTTSNHGSISHTHTRDYSDSEEYSTLLSHGDQFLSNLKLKLADLTPEQKTGLEKKLMTDGITIRWAVEDTDGDNQTHTQSSSYTLASGESVEDFLARAIHDSKNRTVARIRFIEDEGDINIHEVSVRTSLPSFSYDVYEEPSFENSNEQRPINVHSLDTKNKDGHILFEAGGIHAWEYGGKAVSSLTQTNPNDAAQPITGYFARKIAFQNSSNNEFSGTTPFLTQKEKDLLTKILKIPYGDASGVGQLTPQEWSQLKENLINARDNLNGNSQLQTVQLQRAMQTYNQNYDAMSNAQQKIYSLLKDIVSNMR